MSDRSIDIREPRSSRSFGDVFGDLSQELTRLVNSELQAAKEELRADAPSRGRVAQLAFATVAAAFLAVVFVSLAAAIGLSNLIPAGWAFLAVGAVWAVAAAAFYQRRRSELEETAGPMEPVDGNDY
jgi:hypothetical protein